ncbi:MAG: winged helix-turn-helix domain-containing protein [Chloroflexales bacterium]|nr:winged helix-turn-helix domain-containing protein [Chloroflexales bacterium]
MARAAPTGARSGQAEPATRLGTVPDVLNRALRTLVAAGLIVVERQRIRILDRAGLEARAPLQRSGAKPIKVTALRAWLTEQAGP